MKGNSKIGRFVPLFSITRLGDRIMGSLGHGGRAAAADERRQKGTRNMAESIKSWKWPVLHYRVAPLEKSMSPPWPLCAIWSVCEIPGKKMVIVKATKRTVSVEWGICEQRRQWKGKTAICKTQIAKRSVWTVESVSRKSLETTTKCTNWSVCELQSLWNPNSTNH